MKVKLATVVEGDPKAPFSVAITLMGGAISFLRLVNFTLDIYIIMLSLLYGSTWV